MSDLHDQICALFLALVPADGSTVGNTALRRNIETRLQEDGLVSSEEDYWQAHGALVAEGVLIKGQDHGGFEKYRSLG